jgi:hypothetical protein
LTSALFAPLQHCFGQPALARPGEPCDRSI